MFKWLSTARMKVGALKQLHDRLYEAEKSLQQVASSVQVLADKLEELHSEHRKLRGRFYQARGELEVEKPRTREESKAEAFSKIGFVPGRPAPHRS